MATNQPKFLTSHEGNLHPQKNIWNLCLGIFIFQSSMYIISFIKKKTFLFSMKKTTTRGSRTYKIITMCVVQIRKFKKTNSSSWYFKHFLMPVWFWFCPLNIFIQLIQVRLNKKI